MTPHWTWQTSASKINLSEKKNCCGALEISERNCCHCIDKTSKNINKISECFSYLPGDDDASFLFSETTPLKQKPVFKPKECLQPHDFLLMCSVLHGKLQCMVAWHQNVLDFDAIQRVSNSKSFVRFCIYAKWLNRGLIAWYKLHHKNYTTQDTLKFETWLLWIVYCKVYWKRLVLVNTLPRATADFEYSTTRPSAGCFRYNALSE